MGVGFFPCGVPKAKFPGKQTCPCWISPQLSWISLALNILNSPLFFALSLSFCTPFIGRFPINFFKRFRENTGFSSFSSSASQNAAPVRDRGRQCGVLCSCPGGASVLFILGSLLRSGIWFLLFWESCFGLHTDPKSHDAWNSGIVGIANWLFPSHFSYIFQIFKPTLTSPPKISPPRPTRLC